MRTHDPAHDRVVLDDWSSLSYTSLVIINPDWCLRDLLQILLPDL